MPSVADLRRVNVLMTAACNLSCRYCYQNAKNNRRMTWDTLRASVDLLLRSRHPEVRLLFSGGEPLLRLPLIKRAVDYAETVRPRGKTLRYVILTNGMLLDEAAADFLALHRFSTQLSFDGVRAAQRLRGDHTFPVLDRLLDRLRRDHPVFYDDDLNVSLTLMSTTVPFLADSVAYLMGKGVREIAISPLFTHDAGWRADLIPVLDRQFARIFQASLRHYRESGEIPVVLFRRRRDARVRRPRGLTMCGVARGEMVTVDVDGQVVACVGFSRSMQRIEPEFLRAKLDAMRMGDLRDPDFPARLARLPEAVRGTRIFGGKQDKRSSYRRCADCECFAECGVCPTSIGHIPGNTDPDRVPDFLCAFNFVAHRYRWRFPAEPDPADIVMGRAPFMRLMRKMQAVARAARRPRRPSSRQGSTVDA